MKVSTSILAALPAIFVQAFPPPYSTSTAPATTTAGIIDIPTTSNGTFPDVQNPGNHLLVGYHSFSDSCTNIHGDFIDSIVWACCKNMRGSWSQNRFRLGQCLENDRGQLVARRNGGFWRTCQDCTFKDPDRPTVYSCRCWPMPRHGVEHKLVDAEIDLDTFMGNDKGDLVCFGVKDRQRNEECQP
ncbi:hypothetical protein CkaCkLH20_07703 [Colletotrichum karsti]|uniref:Cyanovirin-N domain-containing protein n=1 Tax=Colletotrichum karsti TaxID=1095194 RepID=A0A9P6LGA8_9PEZI|nr:uncharacterized protein CkaCkLH20_07703 [Colletotrichum karsti]KAF9875009.1 hypothetical protein CkaCkLH20_07703 [Colletotrichum karsti]